MDKLHVAWLATAGLIFLISVRAVEMYFLLKASAQRIKVNPKAAMETWQCSCGSTRHQINQLKFRDGEEHNFVVCLDCRDHWSPDPDEGAFLAQYIV